MLPQPHIFLFPTLSSHLCLGFQSVLFPSDFPAKLLYKFLSSQMRAKCPAHITDGDTDNTLEKSSSEAARQQNMWVYRKVSGLAAWEENCKWYSSLPLGELVSLCCESV
jgi:hypothetical protein